LDKAELIEYLRSSEKLQRARFLRSEKKGRLGPLSGPFFLIKVFFQKDPSMFMNLNPAYNKYNIGNYSYGFPEIIDSRQGANLKVGKFCSFAAGVKILLSAEHQIYSITSYPLDVFWGGLKGYPSKGDVVIGNDVWVGCGVTILSGITIGDGAVVGAGAVVTHDVPPYAVAVGNPAKIIKYRFDPSSIEYLLKLRWWDWSMNKILERKPWLMDVDGQHRLEEMIQESEIGQEDKK
jgi:acetyltransferase-like isoleucine patch superfamily enzyme